MPLHQALSQLIAALPATRAVVSPGSRNAAVMEVLAGLGLQMHEVMDERSAGFQALGMAKGRGDSVILSCTSGSAGLNYYPAIVEAFNSRIPLYVLTADRPAHRVDQWENQTIRQEQIFAQHCRLSLQWTLEQHEEVMETLKTAVHIPGPVHINLSIPEPFYTNWSPEDLKQNKREAKIQTIYLDALEGIEGKKILFANGQKEWGTELGFEHAKNRTNMLLLSDLVSDMDSTVEDWDAYLYSAMRSGKDLSALQPEVLVTTGTYHLSKGLKQFLKKYPPQQHYHLGLSEEFGDPFETQPIAARSGKSTRVDPDYKELWVEHLATFKKKMDAAFSGGFNEFEQVERILSNLPEDAVIHFANSMPVRYASFLRSRIKSSQLYANRGTAGIDGCSSTALGHALVTEKEVYLITGDVAFFYDINALNRAALPNNLKFILLNNQGGRIFEFIDGPEKDQTRLGYQIATQERTAELICQHFGLEYLCVRSSEELGSSLDLLKTAQQACLLELITDPQENKSFYQLFKNLGNE